MFSTPTAERSGNRYIGPGKNSHSILSLYCVILLGKIRVLVDILTIEL